MKTRTFVVAVAVAQLGWLAAGCTEAGQSVVLMEVTASQSVDGVMLTSVGISASQQGKEITRHSWEWKATGLKIGLRLPASVSGDVEVSALGIASGGSTEAHAPAKTVKVSPGKSTEVVSLVLQFGPPPAGTGGSGGGGGDGGADGGGGTGGGGGTDAGVDTAPYGSADLSSGDVGAEAPVGARAWSPAGLAEMNADEIDTQPPGG